MQAVIFRHDRRRPATHGRVQIYHAAARFQTIDIYLTADDVDISIVVPSFASTLFGSGTGYLAREPGAYNVVLTEPGTKNVVGGPLRLELEQGRNYGVILVDAPDITAADMLVYKQTPD